MNPQKAPSLDKSAATEKSTYHSNQFPQVVTEKVNRNLLLVPAPTYVWRREERRKMTWYDIPGH